ncbi:MAG TPA: IPT/TIG domain-containing protein [Candidatus Thermoplasmatota archaeon]|nr:IPT/TIG domain-containing protein [Candidatus Thermoplasmatota archaeon]
MRALVALVLLAAFSVPPSVGGASPTIIDVSPTKGPTGAEVVVNGTDLDSVTSVALGGAPAAFTVDDATTLRFTVPALWAGPSGYTLRVGSAEGNATWCCFRVTNVSSPYPIISSFEPRTATPGENVTVYGNGFVNATNLSLEDRDLPFSLIADDEIRFRVPIDQGVGYHGIHVRGSAGNDSVCCLEVGPPPRIDSLDPESARWGDVVLLRGASLDKTTMVRVGGTDAEILWKSTTAVGIRAPVMPNGTYAVYAESPRGAASACCLTVSPNATSDVAVDVDAFAGTLDGTAVAHVKNLGEGRVRWVSLHVEARASTAGVETREPLGDAWIEDLAPGASFTVVLRWDTTGNVGEQHVHAIIHASEDDDPRNDVDVDVVTLPAGSPPAGFGVAR